MTRRTWLCVGSSGPIVCGTPDCKSFVYNDRRHESLYRRLSLRERLRSLWLGILPWRAL